MIDIQANKEDTRSSKTSGHNNNNSSQIRSSNISYNGWVKTKDANDEIFFVKGNMELAIYSGGRNIDVGVGRLGDGKKLYIYGGKDCATLNEALSVAKKYMNTH